MVSHMGAVVSHDGSKKLVAVILGINILDTIMGPGLIKIQIRDSPVCSEKSPMLMPYSSMYLER